MLYAALLSTEFSTGSVDDFRAAANGPRLAYDSKQMRHSNPPKPDRHG
jgi:hypothetical protein